jgi:hypothetical protein
MAVPFYGRAASQADLHLERTGLRLVARDAAAGRDFSEPSVSTDAYVPRGNRGQGSGNQCRSLRIDASNAIGELWRPSVERMPERAVSVSVTRTA